MTQPFGDQVLPLNAVIASAISQMSAGLAKEIVRQGRSMTTDEIASVAMAFALAESANWLRYTIEYSKEERFEQIITLQTECSKLTGGFI